MSEPSTSELLKEIDALRARVAELEAHGQHRSENVSRMRSVLDTLPVPVFMTGLERIIEYVNPAAELIFGYASKDLVGQSTRILYATADEYERQGDLRFTSDPGRNFRQYEVRYKRSSGEVFTSETTSTTIYDETGRVSGGVWVIRDITSGKEMQNALRHSQHFIERVTETSPHITFVFDINREIMVYITRNIYDALGYTPEEILARGTALKDTIGHPDDGTDPDDLLIHIQHMADGEILEHETRWRHANGTYRWFHMRETIFSRLENGEVSQIIGVMEDITERKLSEAEFSTIFQTIPDGVIVASPERIILHVNRAVTRMTGYKPEELIGQSTRILYENPSDFDDPGESHFNPHRADNFRAYEVVTRRKDGSSFVSENLGTLIHDSDGTAIGAIAILRDITHRKQMEDALKGKERELREIIDLVPHMIFAKDRQGRFILANRAAAEAYNLTSDAIVGKSVLDIHHTRDEMRAYMQDDMRVIESQKPLVIPEEFFTDVRGNEHIVQTVKIPYQMSERDDCAVLGVAVDITEQKNAEHRLKYTNSLLTASREALQRLIEQLPIGIQVFDRTGLCVDVNQSHLEMFGADRSEIVNKYNVLKDPLAQAQGTADAAMRALMGETVSLGDIAFDFRRADPRYARTSGTRTISVTIFPVFDHEGGVVNIVGMNHDVTERRQSEAQHVELTVQTERVKLLEELISDISHDLKTPLAIIGTSVYLLNKAAETPLQRKYIDRIHLQQERLERLIDGLLTMSRLNRKSEVAFNRLNLATILNAIYEIKLPLAMEKSISLTLEIMHPNMELRGESDELSRVFENLLDNAIYYTPEGGSVLIRAYRHHREIVIAVIDNGIGIEPDDLPHIFERFYRADKARSAETGGTGLGLAIVHKIVEMHHGSIKVDTTPGVGSTFQVVLPAAQTDTLIYSSGTPTGA